MQKFAQLTNVNQITPELIHFLWQNHSGYLEAAAKRLGLSGAQTSRIIHQLQPGSPIQREILLDQLNATLQAPLKPRIGHIGKYRTEEGFKRYLKARGHKSRAHTTAQAQGQQRKRKAPA